MKKVIELLQECKRKAPLQETNKAVAFFYTVQFAFIDAGKCPTVFDSYHNQLDKNGNAISLASRHNVQFDNITVSYDWDHSFGREVEFYDVKHNTMIVFTEKEISKNRKRCLQKIIDALKAH